MLGEEMSAVTHVTPMLPIFRGFGVTPKLIFYVVFCAFSVRCYPCYPYSFNRYLIKYMEKIEQRAYVCAWAPA